MSGLDIAGVLGEHANVAPSGSCFDETAETWCGWKSVHPSPLTVVEQHRQHQAEALTSHLGDWLGSEDVVRAVGEALEDATLTHLGRDLGTTHRDDITRAALAALGELPGGRA